MNQPTPPRSFRNGGSEPESLQEQYLAEMRATRPVREKFHKELIELIQTTEAELEQHSETPRTILAMAVGLLTGQAFWLLAAEIGAEDCARLMKDSVDAMLAGRRHDGTC